MNRLLSVAAAILALVAGVVLWQATRPAELPGLAMAEAQSADIDTSAITEMVLGDPDAPVTLIEYASFTCPHCKDFHQGPMQQIKANYVDTGKVRFVYREVYFDRFGLWAAMVARCGGDDRYFGIVDLIYDQQADWTKGDTPVEIADNLRRIGRTAGLTDAELDACLTDADTAQAMVAKWEEHRVADDIRSTPSFVIDGQKYSNMPYSEFSTVLDEKLGDG